MIWEPYGPYVYLLIFLPSIFAFFFSQDTFFAHFAKYLPRPTGTCEFTRNPGDPMGAHRCGPNGMEQKCFSGWCTGKITLDLLVWCLENLEKVNIFIHFLLRWWYFWWFTKVKKKHFKNKSKIKNPSHPLEVHPFFPTGQPHNVNHGKLSRIHGTFLGKNWHDCWCLSKISSKLDVWYVNSEPSHLPHKKKETYVSCR